MHKTVLSFILAVLLLFIGCGGGETTNPSIQDIAIEKIANYAKDSVPIPNLQDYLDAGVSGVDASNLDEVNQVVEDLTYDKVDTKEEIQALVATLGVVLPNQAPTATAQTITMLEDTTKTITLAGTDLNGDTLTFSITINPAHGTFTNGVYIPTANYNGSDSFSFTANDGSLTSTPATVTITVTSINDNPTVEAGADATITQGDSYTPSPTSGDIDGTIASTIWKEGATTLTFPKTDFSVGAHTLNVTVTDNKGVTSSDTLTLTVTANVTCIPLHKTGQTTTYHNNDDGDYQKGVTKSYTRDDANNIVTDNVTNLMWQDNESVTKKWVTQANYDAGEYSDASGDTATTYCTNLALGGYNDWRLPTIDELHYLTDVGRVNPAFDSVFQNVSQQLFFDYVWSSTTVAPSPSSAFGVSIHNGNVSNGDKSDNIYVRCVRGKNKVISNFVRDNEKEVVNDTITCLMWQDNVASKTVTKTHIEAIEYCEDLSFAGFDDWRLPNRNELYSIGDRSRYNPAIKDAFLNVVFGISGTYWSSTTFINSIDGAWVIYFTAGMQAAWSKSNNYYVRCVRAGQ